MPELAASSVISKYPFRILSLDGGGSKGVYTLGVLNEVEALIGQPLGSYFDLIYGTSTGAIIGAMLGLGMSVASIKGDYFRLIPRVMGHSWKKTRSAELAKQASEIFRDLRFDSFITRVGIVAANYELERPFIFKTSMDQAFGRKSTFAPGFGCTIAEAVIASAAAYPFFEKKEVKTVNQGNQLAYDGGFVANNPTLFAIADAKSALGLPNHQIKVLSVGVGHYKEPNQSLTSKLLWMLPGVQLAQKQFAINSNTVETMRKLFFNDIECIRIDDAYPDKRYETDLLESEIKKLELLYGLGRESFAQHEAALKRGMVLNGE